MKAKVRTEVHTPPLDGLPVDITQAKAFLKSLHRHVGHRDSGFRGYLFKRQTAGSPRTLLWPTPWTLPRLVSEWRGSTFVSICTYWYCRRANNAICVPALWADLDPHAELSPDDWRSWAQAACDRLALSTVPPTLLVASGRGVHAYWRLADPVRLRPFYPNRDALAAAVVKGNKALESLFGGDSVGDLARCLRLPGSINPRTGTLCKLLDWEGPEYDFWELLSALKIHGMAGEADRASTRTAPGGVPDDALGPVPSHMTVEDLQTLPGWARALVVEGAASGGDRYTKPGGGLDRSRADMAAVGAMVAAGWSDVRMAAVFAQEDWRIGDRFRELRDLYGAPRADDYLSRTRTRARDSRWNVG